MTWRVVTAPASEPVSLSEAKAHLRLEESADDTYVTTLIAAARTHIEKACARGLVLQTIELLKPGFLAEGLALEGGHLATTPNLVVKYLDEDNVEQTLGASNYYVVTGGEHGPARLYLEPDGEWPELADRVDALRISYRVGWDTPAAVPASLRQATLLLVSQMYEHRTPEVAGVLAQVQFAVEALISPFTFWGT